MNIRETNGAVAREGGGKLGKRSVTGVGGTRLTAFHACGGSGRHLRPQPPGVAREDRGRRQPWQGYLPPGQKPRGCSEGLRGKAVEISRAGSSFKGPDVAGEAPRPCSTMGKEPAGRGPLKGGRRPRVWSPEGGGRVSLEAGAHGGAVGPAPMEESPSTGLKA